MCNRGPTLKNKRNGDEMGHGGHRKAVPNSNLCAIPVQLNMDLHK